jgi:hypothetical protein
MKYDALLFVAVAIILIAIALAVEPALKLLSIFRGRDQ